MQQEDNLAGRQQAESQPCKSELCTQQAGRHQTMVGALSKPILSSCTHDFIATCHTYDLTYLDTWYATKQTKERLQCYRCPQSKQEQGYSTIDAHKANKGKAAVPEGVQHNVLNLQVIQEVLAQLGDRQPLLLALPSQLLQHNRQ